MILSHEVVISSNSHQLPIGATITVPQGKENLPVIVFAHGFKGFKDWGYFPMAANWFASQGFAFVRFNFSHNGTSIEHPQDFVALENFGKNNFSIELNDFDDVLTWISAKAGQYAFNTNKIYSIGHSRGGGISLIKANEDSRIKKVITWASVADFESRMKVEGFEEWKKNGVTYIPNSRTNQNMPLYFQFYENLDENRERFLIKKAAKNLSKPLLIIHGTNDETVPLNEANALHQWANDSRLHIIENADHTFNTIHPYTEQDLNEIVLRKLNVSKAFLNDELL